MEEDMILPDDMPEETSQPEEVSTEVVQTEEPTQETVEETQVETTEQGEDTTTQTEVEQPKIKVKFNHEEMELNQDEAIPLIQKGMNYDKVQEKLSAFENDPRFAFIDEMAQMYNLTPEEYIKAVREDVRQKQLDELIQDNIPEEYAQEMLENREFRQKWNEQQEKQQEENQFKADYQQFKELYPDVKDEDIPDSVLEKVLNGEKLVNAYQAHENQQLKARIKILEQNQKNTKKAPVTGVTTHGDAENGGDPFLEGFDSDF